jgi:TP901 family phage tail tape measure protein
VLSLAKAGNLDVADAASIAAKALNAFGLAGSEAVRVADLLAAAANASSADVADISLGLAQVGAGAKQMGVGLQDTIAALALFTNAGIRGQDAGTSLKQMFIQLASPTKQASELMKSLGLNFFDAAGNFVGLEKASGLLQTKLKGLTQE